MQDNDDDVFEPEILDVNGTWSLDRLQEYRKYLQDALMRLHEESGSIKNQLVTAQIHQHQTGEYADRSWWRRANDALLYKKRHLQAVQMSLGETNRCIKQAQHLRNEGTQDRAFIKAARRMLPDDVFMQILDASRADR